MARRSLGSLVLALSLPVLLHCGEDKDTDTDTDTDPEEPAEPSPQSARLRKLYVDIRWSSSTKPLQHPRRRWRMNHHHSQRHVLAAIGAFPPINPKTMPQQISPQPVAAGTVWSMTVVLTPMVVIATMATQPCIPELLRCGG